MHVFVSQKPTRPVRWHQAFPDAITVHSPQQAQQRCGGEGCIWLDFSGLSPADRQVWLEQCRAAARPVVVLSNVPNDSEAVRVFSAGACGYCHALAAASQLKEVALVVEHGGYWVGATFIEKVLRIGGAALTGSQTSVESTCMSRLTDREVMVAQQVAQGATNREIAQALDITERTVKAHISSIFAKTGARDRIQLVLMLNQVDVPLM